FFETYIPPFEPRRGPRCDRLVEVVRIDFRDRNFSLLKIPQKSRVAPFSGAERFYRVGRNVVPQAMFQQQRGNGRFPYARSGADDKDYSPHYNQRKYRIVISPGPG